MGGLKVNQSAFECIDVTNKLNILGKDPAFNENITKDEKNESTNPKASVTASEEKAEEDEE
mgnify:CR=1 FL=1